MPSCASSLSIAACSGERRDMSFHASVASCASSMRRMSLTSFGELAVLLAAPARLARRSSGGCSGSGRAGFGTSASDNCDDARREPRACRRSRLRDLRRGCVRRRDSRARSPRRSRRPLRPRSPTRAGRQDDRLGAHGLAHLRERAAHVPGDVSLNSHSLLRLLSTHRPRSPCGPCGCQALRSRRARAVPAR